MEATEKHKREVSQGTPKLALNEVDAAHSLGLKPRTLQNWRWEGRDGPPWVRISSRCVRYLVSDLEQWARERTETSSPA